MRSADVLDDLALLAPFVAYGSLQAPALGAGALLLAPLVLRARAVVPVLAFVACVHAVAAVARPLALPNHHYVLGCLAACAVLPADRRSVADAARWLYVALMGFATLQKVLSPTFRDGSYLAWLLVDGGLFDAILRLAPGWTDVTAANRALVAPGAYPPTLPPRLLYAPEGLELAGRALAAVIVLVEAALCGLAALRPRGGAFHALALAFVVLLPLIRPEWVFAATVAALGALIAGDDPRRRPFQLVSVAWSSVAMVLQIAIAGSP